MKAFSTSKENFEKYVSLDKKLIKKEKEEEFVSPGTV